MDNSRREFLKHAALFTASVPCIGMLGNAILPSAYAKEKKSKDVPLPPGQVAISESDAVATAIGFKHNAKDIDYTKYPQRKKADAKNQFCESCALFSRVNEGWGKCQMLTNGLVNNKGWCGSWSKKS